MTASNQSNPFIDALRGFCIISVILLHLFIHLPLPDHLLQVMQPNIIKIIFKSGYYGVMIFFVISGYLITLSCIKHFGSLHKIKIWRFYQLRFARIAPCLFLLLIILSILEFFKIQGFNLADRNISLLTALFSALTFQINVLQAKAVRLPAVWDVLWSLSVEEIFYLFFPLLCVYFRKSLFIIILLFFICIAPFARTILTHNDSWADHGYLSCLDGICLGIFAALIATQLTKSSRLLFFILTLTGLSLFTLVFFFGTTTYALGITSLGLNVSLLDISIAMILIVTHHYNRMFFNFLNPIQWFGKNSYEIYLSHSFIMVGFKNMVNYFNISNHYNILLYIIALLLSGLLGELIARYFSIPLNQVLRRLSIV